ncbi:toll/interleukin-1 receptor domain-containing protein [Rhizobium leguminosarum]|nr:toll/interleukin-1 receptor domain-containing protein [Rhizobium leguminosarum]
MKIFVSHIAEEATSASALKRALEGVLPQLGAWVSSVDVEPGDDWMAKLGLELKEAKAIVALCSLKSLERPWINFESGFGAGNGLPVIPVCHAGLGRDKVPPPLSRFQALDLREAADCSKLVRRLAKICDIPEPEFDADDMVQQLSPRALVRSGRIGVSLAHQQDRWPFDPTKLTLFAPREAGFAERWKFRELRGEDRLVAAEMAELSGLVVGSPFRAAMSTQCVTEIVEWVHGGGRLLLLGYELGDRHHNANLGTLAQRFGFHPMPDIVGPSWLNAGERTEKPYGRVVTLEAAAADPHELTRDITELRLANLQTVMVDPEATAWLKVGRNAIYRTAPRTVIYEREGTFGSPGGRSFEAITGASWIPVAAEAPSGLCGRGAVHFIGTWDLLPPLTEPADQRTILVERLLNWLSGKN